MWNGASGGEINDINKGQNDNIFACMREKDGERVVVVLNLSSEPQVITLDNDLLAGEYTDVFSRESVYPGIGYTFDLTPWKFVVLAT